MNRSDYIRYQHNVREFFTRDGIENLSIVDNDENQEPHFSWRHCDCCGTTLGGNRYDCNGYNQTTEEIQDGYVVCEDCVYYAEYGWLDDQTMLDVVRSKWEGELTYNIAREDKGHIIKFYNDDVFLCSISYKDGAWHKWFLTHYMPSDVLDILLDEVKEMGLIPM